jgi:hypothetical protein
MTGDKGCVRQIVAMVRNGSGTQFAPFAGSFLINSTTDGNERKGKEIFEVRTVTAGRILKDKIEIK